MIHAFKDNVSKTAHQNCQDVSRGNENKLKAKFLQTQSDGATIELTN